MELRGLIIQACNEITEDMCCWVINVITVCFEEAARNNGGHTNTWFWKDKSPCNGLSFCMLVSSTVIEIKILLIDEILDHFMRHPLWQKLEIFFCLSILILTSEFISLPTSTSLTILLTLFNMST
jgi:hypothetical protein